MIIRNHHYLYGVFKACSKIYNFNFDLEYINFPNPQK